jgi:hypothetical protein
MPNQPRSFLKVFIIVLVVVIVLALLSCAIIYQITMTQHIPYHGKYSVTVDASTDGPYTLFLPVITNSKGSPIQDILKAPLDKNIRSISLTNTQYGPALAINASGDFVFSFNKESKSEHIFSNISLLNATDYTGHKYHVYYNGSQNGTVSVDIGFNDKYLGAFMGGRIESGWIRGTVKPGWNNVPGDTSTATIE